MRARTAAPTAAASATAAAAPVSSSPVPALVSENSDDGSVVLSSGWTVGVVRWYAVSSRCSRRACAGICSVIRRRRVGTYGADPLPLDSVSGGTRSDGDISHASGSGPVLLLPSLLLVLLLPLLPKGETSVSVRCGVVWAWTKGARGEDLVVAAAASGDLAPRSDLGDGG